MNKSVEYKTKPWDNIEACGPILRPPAAALRYGVGLSTYYELIKTGDVPGFAKLSSKSRASGVPQNFVDAAIAAKMSLSKATRGTD